MKNKELISAAMSLLGKSRSKKKQAAARQNGKLGGAKKRKSIPPSSAVTRAKLGDARKLGVEAREE
jgi:hypothetical protein